MNRQDGLEDINPHEIDLLGWAQHCVSRKRLSSLPIPDQPFTAALSPAASQPHLVAPEALPPQLLSLFQVIILVHMTQAGAQDGEGGEEKAASLFSLVPACTRPIWFLQGWAINKKRYFTSLECISQTTLGSFGPDLYSKPHYSEDRRPSLRKIPAPR